MNAFLLIILSVFWVISRARSGMEADELAWMEGTTIVPLRRPWGWTG